MFTREEDDEEVLSPEARQSVQDSVLARFKEAADPARMRRVEAQAERENTVNDVLGAFGNYGRNELAARGLKTEDDPFWSQRKKEVQDRVMRARQSQRDELDQIKTEDQLGWQDKERAQKMKEWKDADDVRNGERDANSTQSQLARAVAKRMDPKGNYDGMSAFELKQSIPHLEKIYNAEQQRLGRQDTLNFQAGMRADARKAAQDAKDEAKREKDAKDEEALVVPGFERDPSVRIKPDEAAKLRDANGQMKDLKANIAQYRALIKENGSFEYGGEEGAKMKSLATTIKMNLKNLYELGALSGPDMAIIEGQIGDPESKAALFSRDSTVMSGLDQTAASIEQGFKNKMAGKGYRSSGNSTSNVAGKGSSGSFGEATAAPAGKTLTGKKYSPSRNQTRLIYSDGSEEIVDGKK